MTFLNLSIYFLLCFTGIFSSVVPGGEWHSAKGNTRAIVPRVAQESELPMLGPCGLWEIGRHVQIAFLPKLTTVTFTRHWFLLLLQLQVAGVAHAGAGGTVSHAGRWARGGPCSAVRPEDGHTAGTQFKQFSCSHAFLKLKKKKDPFSGGVTLRLGGADVAPTGHTLESWRRFLKTPSVLLLAVGTNGQPAPCPLWHPRG